MKLFCQLCKSKQKQFHVDNSNKTCKSTNNQLSNFGLIEETMYLSHILSVVTQVLNIFEPSPS